MIVGGRWGIKLIFLYIYKDKTKEVKKNEEDFY